MSKPDYRKKAKAYHAIELACLENSTYSPEFIRADKAMIDLLKRRIEKSEFDYWVGREEEMRNLKKDGKWD